MTARPQALKTLCTFAAAAAMLAPLAMTTPAAADDYPSDRLEWTIAFGPGGGNDILSRTLISILQKYDLYPGEIVAENRAGGSGAVGWGYVYSNAGNPYNISTTSGSYINTPLQADTPWQPEDFTPIALLATDDLVLTVRGDSDIDTLEEFVEHARENPPAIGGIGTVNVDFIVTTLFARAADFDVEYVAFNAQGELTTALLSGALDAMVVNPYEALGLMESGDLKGLAFSGVSTPEALGDIPTFQEAGYDVSGVSMPRGLILPPDVPEEAQQWWIETMQQVVETPEWQKYIDDNLLTENILWGEDFLNEVILTRETFAGILREIGAIE
jgi:putative tricarboxylic transport membrane protein